MNIINTSLRTAGYELNLTQEVWRKSGFIPIHYSDGDETEERIINAIEQSNDLTSLSDELEIHCIDWPSTYHLSKRRGNLVRPFLHKLANRRVLEVGSGMGAITRVLGESGAEVLALEGTSRRAYATRLRTRDLKNVSVLSEKFSDYNTDLKFDFITLIGVLEYSNLYSAGDDPHRDVLKRCFEILKPDGHLIIAIENKLGLKYFAGANEDHLGIPMFGLEDLYDSTSVRTFGKFELENLLSSTGFKSKTFNAPLPDYKLTTSVIAEAGFNEAQFNSIDLIRDSFGADPQLPQTLAFNPELVLNSLEQNNLSLEFANSFLVVAGKKAETFLEESELAWHFSTNRRKAYCTKTVFKKRAWDKIEVIKSRMSSTAARGLLTHDFAEVSTYLVGRLFRDDLELHLATPLWSHLKLEALLQSYKNYLIGFQIESPSKEIDVLLTKNSIDLIPRNIVIDRNGMMNSFDHEWQTQDPVDIRQVLFRAVLSLHTISIFAQDEFGETHTYESLFQLFCDLLHLEIDDIATSKFIEMEILYQEEITANEGNVQDFKSFFSKPMGRQRFSPQLTRERDNAVAERDNAVAERDNAVAERDIVLHSTIWKLTKPYRKLRRLF